MGEVFSLLLLFLQAQIFTWHGPLQRWSLPDLRAETLAPGPFSRGGCLVDVNRDGREDVVLNEGSGLNNLVWFEAPHWRRHLIDTEIEMHDCLPATLHGRSGFLMIHRYSQLRFYELVRDRWEVRDVYSIYTASRQGGLALADIDRDGRIDIVAGNYWARSPHTFDLPWRLFAINVVHELPDSATFRLALLGPDSLVAAQRALSPGKLLVFHRPTDAKEQWPFITLAEDLHFPRALLTARDEILVGENNGRSSRVFRFKRTLRGWSRTTVATGTPVLDFVASGGRIWMITASGPVPLPNVR